MNFRNKLLWLPLTGGLALFGSAPAAGTTAAAKFPGYVVDEVVVPVPSEIFAVLDKLGSPNWKDEVRKTKLPDSTDRMELSLIFGEVVAEGFVAVQAQDKQAVEDIGRDVINLVQEAGPRQIRHPACAEHSRRGKTE